jgi:hypothetical protein
MELNKLKANKNNPRRISEHKLEQLKKSIYSFEKMLEARPIIVNKDFKILGGNMRYTALLDLGYDTIPDHWVKVVEFTKEEEREFIIKDNLGYGEWDWDMLHIEWKAEELQEWGMEINNWQNELLEVGEYEDKNLYNEPSVTDDEYSKFEIIMLHDNKKKFLNILNYIQEKYYIEKQEDAIMKLINKYQENE